VTLAGLVARLRTRELSPREAVEYYLERIERHSGLNAYIAVRAEEALAEAEAPQRAPLYGAPVAVKDVIDVADTPTTAASAILRDRVASSDADVVAGLRAAGAIILGKLNLHEFAYGALTTSPHFGPARNPWSPDRVCGGSSGGSAAAAAADLAAAALGTDTAGSNRIPACLCGVTGLRPSSGLVSNRGVVPVSWTFDTVGPIARSAEDCALLLDAIAGTRTDVRGGVAGLRVGIVEELVAAAEPEIAAATEAAIKQLAGLGARVGRANVPLLEDAGTIQQLVMLPEASAYHLPWLRTRLADYGADVRARLLAGLLLPATAYVTGLRLRRRYAAGLAGLFERFDLLAAPAMPVVAPRIGEETVSVRGQELPYRLALIPFNSPWSLAGLPAASVPSGFVDGLPVGLTLVGPRVAEETVLRAAHAYQQVTDWHERLPDSREAP
jgi:aspartyl-tRNA(Asn)/glutamyl-tRNA(Gln) amidotransferase subunit A